MDAGRYRRVAALFLAVRELPAAERAAALEAEAAGDPTLREEVESLLAFDRADELIEPSRPAVTSAARAPTAGATGASPRDDRGDPLGLVGTTLDDRYRILAFDSEGGFGYVYRAEHVRWGRAVAVKVLKLDRADEAIKRAFVKEGALLNELSRQTTAIVQSYDVGTFVDLKGHSRIFTVLEWLPGRTLAQARRAEGRPWAIARVIATLAPIADALAVAHRSGIAHRDVKPSNIFLVEQEGRGATKLLDFGVAKVAAEYESGFLGTGGRITAFTVAYAAPEQLAKRYGTTGPWTDVYALALVAVELLLGRRPIDDDDPVTATRRLGDPAACPTPRRLGLPVSDAVEAVFVRALATRTSDRYRDAASFWCALVAAAGDRPGAGDPPPRPWSRLPWALIAGAVVLAAALALWLVFSAR